MTDKELFEMLRTEDDYKVIFDNNSVWVESDDGTYIDSFSKYGQDLLVELFNLIGIKVEHLSKTIQW